MKAKFETILDECLAQLRAGAKVEDCLARYPEHAEALQPLLAAAMQVHLLPVPAPDRAAMNAGRQRMIETVRAKAARQEQGDLLGLPWLRRPRPFAGTAFGSLATRAAISFALVLLVIALSAGGLVAAAQGSLPGDPLYPLKRAAERARMTLTLDPVAQQQLQHQFDRERHEEVRAVLTAGRPTSLEFRGILEQLSASYWIVAGLRVHLDDQSVVEGQPFVGAIIAVRADSLGDGTLLARQLQVESSPLLPSPTPTRTASPTPPPPTPSATATQTQTPEPTASHTPTPTPTRQATLTPSRTPTATPQPQPTDPPVPTETREPEPTDHPEPGETEEPESTDHPKPGETHEPESTDHPEPGETEDPEPTDHPEPGETEQPESTRHPQPSATEDDDDSEHSHPTQTGTPQPASSATATPTKEPDSSVQPEPAGAEWPQPTPAVMPTPIHRD